MKENNTRMLNNMKMGQNGSFMPKNQSWLKIGRFGNLIIQNNETWAKGKNIYRTYTCIQRLTFTIMEYLLYKC
jgi:hypothetical protein